MPWGRQSSLADNQCGCVPVSAPGQWSAGRLQGEQISVTFDWGQGKRNLWHWCAPEKQRYHVLKEVGDIMLYAFISLIWLSGEWFWRYIYRSGMSCRGRITPRYNITNFLFRLTSNEVTRFVRSSREWWTYFSRYTYVDEWNLPMILETVIWILCLSSLGSRSQWLGYMRSQKGRDRITT